jgi:hypothetical protein
LLVLALAGPAFAQPDPKVTYCHNPNDPHEITVSGNAAAAHEKHGEAATCAPPCDDPECLPAGND